VPLISSKGLEELKAELARCSTHKQHIATIMRMLPLSVQPSDAYKAWFDEMLLYRGRIQSLLKERGVKLPVADPVLVRMGIYRDRNSGDLFGFAQAVADAIQAELWKCGYCNKRTAILANCPHCKGSIAGMSQARKGLGLILDDKQIVRDESELFLDPKRPRVEITIETLSAPQPTLFEEKEVLA
jgi:hypothetical protein